MEELTQQGTRVPCPYCKELILEGAIKCKHCGSSLRRPAAFSTNNWVWVRNQPDRKVLGVASCISANFNVSATLIRLIFVLLTFIGGSGLLIYLVLAAIIPAEHGKRSLFEAAVDALGAALDNLKNQPSKTTVAPATTTTPDAAAASAAPAPEPPPMPDASTPDNQPSTQSI